MHPTSTMYERYFYLSETTVYVTITRIRGNMSNEFLHKCRLLIR